MQNPIQLFFQWTKKKIWHHLQVDAGSVHYKEREVWWAALGHNIGFEVNGKHELFERPVVILKRYNEHMCFVVPLTTQIKKPLPFYQIPVHFDGKPSVAVISQGRTISTRRLLRKFGILDFETYNQVILAFRSQFE